MKQVRITALELGHLSKDSVSGGDLLLERMYPYLKTVDLTVIVPKIGLNHWQKQKKVEKIIISPNIFDHSLFPLFIFFSYLIRTFEAILALIKLKPSVIYSSTNIFPDIAAAFALKVIKSKTIWVSRIHHLTPNPISREGLYLKNLLAFHLEKLSLSMAKRANLTIALNQSLYNTLQEQGFNKKKLAVLGGGVKYQQIQKTKATKKVYDGIFVGRLHKTKGIFDLVNIWQLVTQRFPKARLAIVGEAKQSVLSTLRKEINSKKLQKNIPILGVLPEVQVYKSLKSSKVFLFTDHEAGFGLAAAEALAAGLPTIGWDIGILGIVFKQGYKKAPLYHYKKFASIVCDLLRNEKEYLRLSKEATIEGQKFDWQIVAKEFNKLLKTYVEKAS